MDECSTLDPCLNGATCHNQQGGYLCVCVNGWTGVNCEINIDDCVERLCFNGGTCHDRVGSYYCECPPGKTGTSRTLAASHIYTVQRLGGTAVRASDFRSSGRGFDSGSGRNPATKLGQLSLPSLRGRQIEYQPSPAGVKAGCARLCRATSVTPRSSEMACL